MLLFVIIFIEILAGAEVDIFVPSFPDLQEHFNLTPFMVELTLGVNLVAQCVAALFIGNLGDKYGRRPIILAGLVLFILGSLACTFAPSYNFLILGRLLQGIGISGPAVLAYLVAADIYTPKEQQKILGVLNGVVGLAMASAPVAGSYIDLYFGWQGNFAVLLIMGLVCFALTMVYLPTGMKNNEIKISLKEYIPVLKSKKAVSYILAIGFSLIPYWAFIGLSPILFMKDLGVSLEHFGFYQGTMAATFSIISIFSSKITGRLGQKAAIKYSLKVIYLFIALCILLVVFDIRSPNIITAVLMVLSVGLIIPINILWPMSLEAVEGAKGRITAAMLSGRLVLTAVVIQIVSYFYQGSFFHIGIAMCVCLVVGLYFMFKVIKMDRIIAN
jgi:MFS transporter, DHA1 family, multidrug resistance protein